MATDLAFDFDTPAGMCNVAFAMGNPNGFMSKTLITCLFHRFQASGRLTVHSRLHTTCSVVPPVIVLPLEQESEYWIELSIPPDQFKTWSKGDEEDGWCELDDYHGEGPHTIYRLTAFRSNFEANQDEQLDTKDISESSIPSHLVVEEELLDQVEKMKAKLRLKIQESKRKRRRTPHRRPQHRRTQRQKRREKLRELRAQHQQPIRA